MKRLKLLWCMMLWLPALGCLADDLRGDTLDICSYQLHIDLHDFDSRILHGQAVIHLKAKQDAASINLDLLKLEVDSVFEQGQRGLFTYNDSVLHVGFGQTLHRGDSMVLTVYYHGRPGVLPGDFGGFYWDDKYAFNIGVSFASEPHSDGRVWFPCFDNFKVRSNYEFFITTRTGEKAFCNGILQDVIIDGPQEVWQWKLDEKIPAYLASVAVAAYKTLHDTVQGMHGPIPVEIAALPEDTALVRIRFNHLHQAFNILEHYWGPYRWERVGYCMVPFEEGAMEHATNIAFMQRYLTAYAKECETTMAHELSHHWFGNLVTCETEPDMWLNEGWATYSQTLFIEGLYGADSARQYRNTAHLNAVITTPVSDGGYLPVSGVNSKHTYGSTVYQKGGDVINTLRYYLGDSVFFSCMKAYLNDFAFKTANTLQLRDYLSRCSGRDLSDFFNDWVLAPGFAQFSISDKQMRRVPGKWRVNVNIHQRLSHAPQLYKNVPVTISYFDRAMKRHDEEVYVSGENTLYSTLLDFKPDYVALDFDERLAQAVTHGCKMVRDTGAYYFGSAMMSVEIQGLKDSSLIRCSQNWLPAEANGAEKHGLHLDNARYWTVDGVFDPGMKAAGIFEYSAMEEYPLDSAFITNEDSLVMMYRPNGAAAWQIANSFVIDKGTSDTDMTGNLVVYPLKKGDYALGIFDSNRKVGVPIKSNPGSLKNTPDFKMLRDATGEGEIIEFRKNIFERVELYDVVGRVVVAQKITDKQTKAILNPGHTSNASYVVTLTAKTGLRISKKLNKL